AGQGGRVGGEHAATGGLGADHDGEGLGGQVVAVRDQPRRQAILGALAPQTAGAARHPGARAIAQAGAQRRPGLGGTATRARGQRASSAMSGARRRRASWAPRGPSSAASEGPSTWIPAIEWASNGSLRRAAAITASTWVIFSSLAVITVGR